MIRRESGPVSGARSRAASERGRSLVELVLVLGLVATLAAVTVPLTASVIDAGRARHAAGFVASRFRLARHQAIIGGASVGLVFDRVGGDWVFRVCVDRNGNGLRRTELAAGPDECLEGPHVPHAMFPGVTVAVDPAIRGPGGEPGSADPVRFGRSDMISFSPGGSCTPGSLYLRSRQGVQYVVRVAGVTGRTRVLRYDPVARAWSSP